MINQLRLYLSATILLAACGSIRKNKELQGYNMNTAAIATQIQVCCILLLLMNP